VQDCPGAPRYQCRVSFAPTWGEDVTVVDATEDGVGDGTEDVPDIGDINAGAKLGEAGDAVRFRILEFARLGKTDASELGEADNGAAAKFGADEIGAPVDRANSINVGTPLDAGDKV